jgi:Cro/C1-type helix-turn-helix DNA-binding protein
MGNPLEESDMPPLTLEMHRKLRAFEHGLRVALGECSGSHSLIDPDAAFEYARTYAVKFYDCFYDFYSQIPDPSYKPHWSPASQRFSLQRVVRCLQSDYNVEQFFRTNPDRVTRIKKTIAEHAKTAGGDFSVLGRQASDYARAGIDMASASPLMLMAHAAAQESARRGGTAPPLAAPKRRIPRSIHSESAAKKLEDYLNAKGVSQTQFAIRINVDPKTLYRFRTTGNVGKPVAQAIAQAMGITLEEFISR